MRVISSNMTRIYWGRRDTQQFFHRQYITVLIAHHGHVIEAVHVADALVVGLALGQFLGGTVQQADMRIGALDDLAVHLQDQTQHAVGRRVLGTEIQGEIA
jgi:ribosomal protein S18 acetylase RimI-like enzyme